MTRRCKLHVINSHAHFLLVVYKICHLEELQASSKQQKTDV